MADEGIDGLRCGLARGHAECDSFVAYNPS